MACPCDENKVRVIHSKGIYTKPYKKPCDDCAKKKNITKKKGRSNHYVRTRR